MGQDFSAMLREFRVARSLTQAALAERAALSEKSIAALERGRRRGPRLTTVHQLGRALELSPEVLAAFAAAAAAQPASSDAGAPDKRPRSEPAEQGPAVGNHDGRGRLPLPAAALRMRRTRFVGRDSECRHLRVALRASALTVVTGEAGIGKTRLVSEVARTLDDDGFNVAWGRSTQESLGAYAPWVEIVRQLLAGLEPDELGRIQSLSELGRIVPEVTSAVAGTAPPSRAGAAAEERFLSEAVAGLARHRSPLLIVLEDAHWADQASLHLLTYLATDPSLEAVSFLVTAREGELEARTPGYLADLSRRRDVTTLHLEGLAVDELLRLISDVVSAPAAPAFVDSVAAATDGNPFFAEELASHLLDSGGLEESPDGLTLLGHRVGPDVPHRVRATLLGRLSTLNPTAVELLRSGALLGREFEISIAASCAGLNEDDTVDAVEDSLLSGLVIETGPDRLSFSHALVQEAVADSMSILRRTSVHRRLALLLTERRGDAPAMAAEIAGHWEHIVASDPSAVATAASWEIRAGDAALASAAAGEAIARYERAATLWSRSTAGHGDALIRLGRALRYAGRHEEADERYRQAYRLGEILNEPEILARAALGLSEWLQYWQTDEERVALIEKAIAACGPEQAKLVTAMKAILATQLAFSPTAAAARRRQELERDVTAVVTGPDVDPELLLQLGLSRIYVTVTVPDTLASLSDRLLAAGTERRELRVVHEAHYSRAWAALEKGDMAALKTAGAAFRASAQAMDDRRDLGFASVIDAAIAIVEGRFEEAEVLAGQAVATGLEVASPNAEITAFIQTTLVALERGQDAEVLAVLQAVPQYGTLATYQGALLYAAAASGQRELAGALFDELVADDCERLAQGIEWLATMAMVSDACVRLERTDEAKVLYRLFASTSARTARLGPMAGWWGPVDHHLGALCRLVGQHRQARAHLERALALSASMSAPAWRARTEIELARLWLADGDGQAAAALATSARDVAERLGCARIAVEAGDLVRT